MFMCNHVTPSESTSDLRGHLCTFPSESSTVCFVNKLIWSQWEHVWEWCPFRLLSVARCCGALKLCFVRFSGLEFRFHFLYQWICQALLKIVRQSWGLSNKLASEVFPQGHSWWLCWGMGMFPQWSRQACSDWHLSAGTFSSLCRYSRKIWSPGSSLLSW